MIHHTQSKKAEKLGYQLEEVSAELVSVYLTSHNIKLFGVSVIDAIKQADAANQIILRFGNITMTPDAEFPNLVEATRGSSILVGTGAITPVALLALIDSGDGVWSEVSLPDDFDAPQPNNTKSVERINGVPVDGAVAYLEGITAADCPFTSETDDDDEYKKFYVWNEQWDAAADGSIEDEPKQTGSVVKSKYRIKYTEMGHANHCGDWLADILNNLCLVGKAFNLAIFEDVCNSNGVSLDKYDRTKNGWVGRIRMTGRNILSNKVVKNGVLTLPDGTTTIPPQEWLATKKPVK